MKLNFKTLLVGGFGFCVGFTVCCLCFVPKPEHKQPYASAMPRFEILAGLVTDPSLGKAVLPREPEWQPELILPTVPPKFAGH